MVNEIAESYGHKPWVKDIEYSIIRRFVVCLIPGWWHDLGQDTDEAFLRNERHCLEGPEFKESDLSYLFQLPWDSLCLVAKILDPSCRTMF